MKRKLVSLSLVVLMVLVLPGCWSRYEIESLAIVGGIGIDKIRQGGRDKFLVTFNILRPSLVGGGTEGGGTKSRPIYWRMTAVGNTMADAERNLNTRSPRRVFYGQARYVIIGERLAREGIMDIIDYLQRHKDIRLRTLILLTKGTASDEMLKIPELENSIAREIQSEEATGSPKVSKVKIKDLAKTTDELITPGLDPVIAQVRPVNSPPTETGGGPVSVLSYEGGGVMKVDKLVGWLNGDETRGYLLGLGQANQAALPIEYRKHPSDDVSIMLTRSSSKIKVNVGNGQVTAAINIRAEGDLIEYHETKEIAASKNIAGLEKYFEAEIRREVQKTVEKAQKLDADIFGFGAQLHRSSPQAWRRMEKDWYKILPQIRVTVNVRADIRRTGFISNPYVAK